MRRATSFVAAVLLGQLCLAGDCVDGVTPDCSSADAGCGPDVDGAAVKDASSPIGDAAADAVVEASPPSDAASDASDDADANDQ